MQSLAAGLCVLIVFIVMNSLKSHLAVASLGASAFIVFTSPHKPLAKAKNLLGGYLLGGAWGTLFYHIIGVLELLPRWPIEPYVVGCALAVACTMFTMSLCKIEHAPSCALAIAVATSHAPIALTLVALSCVCVLCAIKWLLKKRLVNL